MGYVYTGKFYVYIIQNKINNKIYVGKTNNFLERITRHRYESKNNIKCLYIQRAINKYGWDNFTSFIIEEWSSEEDALEAEMFWIDFFQSHRKEIGYNLTKGGEGTSGYKHTEESKKKMSMDRKIYFNTPEMKRKMSQSLTGRSCPKGWTHSEETRNTMRINHANVKGENNPRAKLTWDIVFNIRNDYSNGTTIKELIIKYQMSNTSIRNIVKFKTWL